MKTIFKHLIKIALVVFVMLSVVGNSKEVASAETFKVNPESEDDKYVVSYDKSKYIIFWVSRKTITLYSQYGSTWWNLDEGNKLGTATIRVYYLEPKVANGGNYYAIAGCQVSMDPESLKGNVKGMAQLAEFGINTPNEDSRVCSPTQNILNIQASKSTNSSSGFTAGTGLKYNITNKEWEASADFNFSKSWGSCTSYTYNTSNVVFTQRTKDNGYASWTYDYKSKDEDVTWNAYLMSSSKVLGQVVYRIDEKPSISNRNKCIPKSIKYEIRFGAGDSSTGEVADRLGWSTNRDMSIMKGTMKLSY